MTDTLSTVAANFTADAIALRTAGEATGKAQIAFGRSVIAAVLTGVSTLAFAEAQLIAVYGAPKDAKGKAIKSASGLREVDGGFAAYQAWRVIAYVCDNVDTDKAHDVTHPVTGDVASVGDGAIRALLTSFALGDTALRGLSGLKKAVEALVTAHATATATAMGIVTEADDKGEGDASKGDNDNTPPVSLADAATAMLLRLQNASDAEMEAAKDALAALADYADARWNAIADAAAGDVATGTNG